MDKNKKEIQCDKKIIAEIMGENFKGSMIRFVGKNGKEKEVNIYKKINSDYIARKKMLEAERMRIQIGGIK